MANYDFKLFYKSGQTNIEADALLRILWNTDLDRDSVKIIILAKSSQWSPLYEMWGSNLIQLHEKDVLTAKQAQISPNNLPDSKGTQVKMKDGHWQNIQMADPEISTIVSIE